MIALLKGMFIDLHNRTDAMVDRLAKQTLDTPGASSFKETTILELLALKQKLRSLLDEGILDDPFFAPNSSIIYSHLEEEFREIEQYLYQPISRYDLRAEGYFELIIHSIYKEINFSQKPPFVSTMSNSDAYFRAYPKYKIIMLPQGEEKHLLNLGDLYHEIGHLIYMQYDTFLIGDFVQRMTDHYRNVPQHGGKRDHGMKISVQHARQAWKETWMEELACDLMATYAVGPAYGWSHLKICVLSSKQNTLFSKSNLFRNHPPDDIRMQIILRMLDLIGCKTQAAAIASTWHDLTAATQNSKPPYYDEVFPADLLSLIAQNVFNGCCDIMLQSYPQQLANDTRPVSKIINEAWDKILIDPDNSTQWTIEQINNILSWIL
ncbi:MAG: hypothetical protein Q8937_04265 [Bacteroidota bacterium]|nr:hypothetical protein [Bacteroidota bacterium]MDP4257424.1 hypothetical protein [Bacteroidota bacterium]